MADVDASLSRSLIPRKARFGEDSIRDRADGGRCVEDAMDLRGAIRMRRAVRAYVQEPLDKALIGELIDAVIQAPSAANEQAWSFCVVQSQAPSQ